VATSIAVQSGNSPAIQEVPETEQCETAIRVWRNHQVLPHELAYRKVDYGGQ